VKVTLIVHVLVGDKLAPEHASPDLAKSPAFGPVSVTLPRVNVPTPLLVTVTVWGALVVPTNWFPKFTFVVERLRAEVLPDPLKVML
jgi:hypothetical protein